MMRFSNACKVAGIGLLTLSAPATVAAAGFWSISYVNEPFYLAGAFHATLSGAAKMDLSDRFRAQTRLSFSRENYGLLEPRRDPRAWDVAWGILGGTRSGKWEASAGIGAILGSTQGELYYDHVWSGGVFAKTTREYRKLLYADVGVPFQAQRLFGRNQKGLGLELSGFISREVRRWGIGFCWQFYLGGPPPPESPVAPIPKPSDPEAPEPGSEVLEE